METTKVKRYSYIVGIDVSKNELDFAVLHSGKFLFHREINNEHTAITELINEVRALPKFILTRCVFCMEQTGSYCNHLLMYLKTLKANVVLENPMQIKNSFGMHRGKNDKIDAIRIAEYAYRHREDLKLWVPRRPIIQMLADLSTLRLRLIGMQMGLKTPLKELEQFASKTIHKQSKTLCSKSIKAVATDLEEVNAYIAATVKSDAYVNHLIELITSVPSIGTVTALQIILTTNEFRDIKEPKKFACYAGVAPFPVESGSMIKRSRVSQIANKKMKGLLHICAMSAVSHSGEIQDYYKRKTEVEGKSKMSVLNAVRNKLVTRVFACVNQDRPYTKEYKRAVSHEVGVQAWEQPLDFLQQFTS